MTTRIVVISDTPYRCPKCGGFQELAEHYIKEGDKVRLELSEFYCKKNVEHKETYFWNDREKCFTEFLKWLYGKILCNGKAKIEVENNDVADETVVYIGLPREDLKED